MNPEHQFPVIVDREPTELLVADELSRCPYLPARQARMPLRLPVRLLTAGEWDSRLAEGDRRHGALMYRTSCPDCCACEPIRVDIARSELSRNQRRVLRRGDSQISVALGPARGDDERLELYEKHITGRNLGMPDHQPMTTARYRNFLVESCCATFEIRYVIDGRLVGVAVTDRAERSLSAHYTFFDPDFARLGIGTYSILTQIELCKRWQLDYLYLGLYVADNRHMSYKARFSPHQRLVDGEWGEGAAISCSGGRETSPS